MAYKFSKGKVYRGDIYNEDDTQQNTYLDWNEDAIGIVAGATTVMVVSGAAAKVGIGTTSPSQPLHVAGNLRVEDGYVSSSRALYGTDLVLASNTSSDTTTIYLEGGSGTEILSTGTGHINMQSGGGIYLLAAANNEIHLGTGGSNSRVMIDDDGKVGIGTSSPTRMLDIQAADSAGIQLNATNHRAYTLGSDAYGFTIFDDTRGTTAGYRFVISDQTDYLGYVGIGDGVGIAASSHPKALLHLSSSDDQALLRVDTTGGNSATTVLFATGSNRVGIGTSSPTSTFEVSGSQAGNYTQTTGDITFNETHYVVDYTGDGNATFTLPDTSGVTGRQYHILSHAQSGENQLTVTGSGGAFQGAHLEGDSTSVTIDGNTPQSLTVLSTGTNWFILHDGRSQE